MRSLSSLSLSRMFRFQLKLNYYYTFLHQLPRSFLRKYIILFFIMLLISTDWRRRVRFATKLRFFSRLGGTILFFVLDLGFFYGPNNTEFRGQSRKIELIDGFIYLFINIPVFPPPPPRRTSTFRWTTSPPVI